MRVKQNVANILISNGIPRVHAEILQGQKTRLTGFSTTRVVECEFSYAILGAGYRGDETFAYLMPYDVLEV